MDFIIANPLYILGGFMCLGLLVYVLTRTRRMPYYALDALLTKSELRFYQTLKQAIPPDMAIMMKVRVADIINCDERDWHRGWGPKISAKHVDFVLINPVTTAVLLAIELDDSTHTTHNKRIERDIFVNKAFAVAKVPLLRIPVQKYYKSDNLINLIHQSIGLGKPRM